MTQISVNEMLAKIDGKNPLAKAVASKELDDLDAIVVGTASIAFTDRNTGPFKRAFAIASCVSMLRDRLTNESMKFIMPLQNTPLGFLTDKRDGGYPMEVVRDVAIEATLRGAYMTGNEVNIISGRCYLTKEFFARAVREFPGLSDLSLKLSVPRLSQNGAEVDCVATWSRDGDRQSIDRTFPIKVNAGMGGDAILGKATRKILAAVHGRITGSEHSFPEGDIDDQPIRNNGQATVINRQLADLDAKNANGGTEGAGREVTLPGPAPSAPSPSADVAGSIARIEQARAESVNTTTSEVATPKDAPKEKPKGIGDANAKPPRGSRRTASEEIAGEDPAPKKAPELEFDNEGNLNGNGGAA